MCLEINNTVTVAFPTEEYIRTHAYFLWENAGKPDQNFWEQAENECNYIVAYKVLGFFNHNFYSIFFSLFLWKKGWNHSSRDRIQSIQLCNTNETKQIDFGIHVFLSLNEAETFAYLFNNNRLNCFDSAPAPLVVVPVHCYKSDFVAKGTYTYCDNKYESAVFTKAFLPKLPCV